MNFPLKLPEGIQLPEGIHPIFPSSYEEYTAEKCRVMNEEVGTLTGYDCKECHNKGLTYFVRDGEIVATPCRCTGIRQNLDRIRRSGLEPLLKRYTFDRFDTPEAWQRRVKALAQAYVSEHGDHWLLLCGQSGAGKSHLCTAAVAALMEQGMAARYMLWRDEAARLKACLGEGSSYPAAIRPFKEVDLLYIDDFLKTAGGVPPTAGDLHLAFEILNARYTRPDKLTVLSCEMTLQDILRADEALGGRIKERAGRFVAVIGRDPKRNHRL